MIVTPAAIEREVGGEEPLQRREPDRQRHPLGRVQHQRRPQEVVPRRDEREDRHGRQRRADDRQHDRPPDPPLPGAVDTGRVDQVVGHAPERLAQQEDVERADDVREDQRRQRVVVVEHVHGEDEARDVGQLRRHDQRREQQVEDRSHDQRTASSPAGTRPSRRRGHSAAPSPPPRSSSSGSTPGSAACPRP